MVKLSPYCKLIYCSKNHLQCASIHFTRTKYINLKLSNVLSFIASTTVYFYKSTDWYYLFCKYCKCDKNTIQNSYTVSYDSSATNDLIRLLKSNLSGNREMIGHLDAVSEAIEAHWAAVGRTKRFLSDCFLPGTAIFWRLLQNTTRSRFLCRL